VAPSEWLEVVNLVTGLWGRSARWAKADLAWSQVAHLDKAYAVRAVRQHFDAGSERPPAIAQVVALARSYGAGTVTRPGPEECDHPYWSIVDEDVTGRLGMCPICWTEKHFEPGRLLTDTELEQRRIRSQR
jgi:hypothetical protein